MTHACALTWSAWSSSTTSPPTGGRQGSRYVYELIFDGDLTSDAPRMPGLVNPETLLTMPTSPTGEATSPSVRSPFTPGAPPGRNEGKPNGDRALRERDAGGHENARPGTSKPVSSYRTGTALAAEA